MVLVTFVRVWKRQKVRKEKRRQQERHHCSLICTGSLNFLNNPSFWFSWPFSMNCIELDKSFRLMCQGRYYHCQALGKKAIEVQRGRVETWKGFPVETGVLGPRGEPGMSLWECMHFHVSPSLRRESITRTMGLQMAVPATQGHWH